MKRKGKGKGKETERDRTKKAKGKGKENERKRSGKGNEKGKEKGQEKERRIKRKSKGRDRKKERERKGRGKGEDKEKKGSVSHGPFLMPKVIIFLIVLLSFVNPVRGFQDLWISRVWIQIITVTYSQRYRFFFPLIVFRVKTKNGSWGSWKTKRIGAGFLQTPMMCFSLLFNCF